MKHSERTNERTYVLHFGPRTCLQSTLFFIILLSPYTLKVIYLNMCEQSHSRVHYICVYIFIYNMYILLRGRYSLFLCYHFFLTNTIALYKTRIYKMIDLYSINRFLFFRIFFFSMVFLFFFPFLFDFTVPLLHPYFSLYRIPRC